MRKAVVAGFDRTALASSAAARRSARSPSTTSRRAWRASRSPAGWGLARVRLDGEAGGRPGAVREVLQAAGFASGKYEGGETLLLVADNADPDKSIAQIAERQLNELGFKTKLRLVTRDTMLTRFCQVPRSDVSVCPSYGWAQDFADPQTMLDPTFNGANILQVSNSNWPELDDPAVNAAIDAAKPVVDPAKRAEAWAAVNKAIVAQAPAIPYMWDYQSAVVSPDVRGVQNGYSTTLDWNFTSLR